MTPPADDGRVSLRGRIEQWRERADKREHDTGLIAATQIRECADELAATLDGMTCATCIHQITTDQCGDGLDYALCGLLSGKAPLGPVRNVKCETMGNFCGAHHPAPPRAEPGSEPYGCQFTEPTLASRRARRTKR